MHPLLKLLPEDQIKRVYDDYYTIADIDNEFIGFTETYEHLSQIIPKHFTVIDFGCAYNPQCYYFRNHKKYIAVDVGSHEMFYMPNCEIYRMSAEDFIEHWPIIIDQDETFAISNYAPISNSSKIIREWFHNLYIFYPSNKKESKEFYKRMMHVK